MVVAVGVPGAEPCGVAVDVAAVGVGPGVISRVSDGPVSTDTHAPMDAKHKSTAITRRKLNPSPPVSRIPSELPYGTPCSLDGQSTIGLLIACTEGKHGRESNGRSGAGQPVAGM